MADGVPCPECGTSCTRMYCSTRCMNRAGERRRRARRASTRYPTGRPGCRGCGETLDNALRSDQAWCSSRCKSQAAAALRRNARHAVLFGDGPRECVHCGAALDGADGHVRYCGNTCRIKSSNDRATARARAAQPAQKRPCAECSAPFATRRQTVRYCSRSCATSAAARQAASHRVRTRAERVAAKVCHHCNGSLAHLAKAYVYCSGRCRRAETYIRHRTARKAYRDRVRRGDGWRAINRGYAHARRARKLATSITEATSEQVAARMSMFSGCWMCGGEWTEVEHVKPLAQGGPHILANLRPACGPCNRRKGASWSGVTEVLRRRAPVAA